MSFSSRLTYHISLPVKKLFNSSYTQLRIYRYKVDNITHWHEIGNEYLFLVV